MTSKALAFVIACSISATAQEAGRPDFSGTWQLASQHTSAFRHRSGIGNHEEPVVIEQRDGRLIVAVQSSDPSTNYEYDLTGGEVVRSAPGGGEQLSTVTRWQGQTLVTRGRRFFTTPDGPRVCEVEEWRRLIDATPNGRGDSHQDVMAGLASEIAAHSTHRDHSVQRIVITSSSAS
jgi:hypothetical protein